jgi:decaprenyl-phosphate phosphoribosyltransferase
VPGRVATSTPPASDGATPRRRPLPLALLVLARPKQWIKNVLVVAAPGAAGVLTEREAAIDTLIAFVCFCLVASSTYYLNDALDAEADRVHPTKRGRIST